MSNEISMTIGNQKITGFKDFEISRSLDSMTGDFTINLVNNTDDIITKQIKVQSIVTIFIGNERLLKGKIYRRARSESNSSTQLSISGRDITGDLVDCSAITSKIYWKNIELIALIKDLTNNFDITINSTLSGLIFKTFSVQQGETVASTIQRACRQKGVIAFTNNDGQLEIREFTQSSFVPAIRGFVRGENIKEISEIEDVSDTYSEIYIKSQNTTEGNAWTKSQLQQAAKATDENILSYRPLIILNDTKVSKSDLQKQVNWLVQYKAGISKGFDIVSKGFRQLGTEENSDPLWELGLLVTLEHKPWEINEQRIISNIKYSYTKTNGSILKATLVDPRTYLSNPADKVVKK